MKAGLARAKGKVLFTLVALLCANGLVAQSQATTGVIEGTVTDNDGAALPGATVALTQVETNYQVSRVTGSDGRFRAPLLPLGPYRVEASLDGYTGAAQEGIQVTVGATVSLSMSLTPGVSEEIVVTTEAPLLETSRGQNRVLFGQEELEGLPNLGRDFLNYTRLTPGVSIVQGPDGEELTINGQKGIQNNVSVDGADFNNPFFGEQRGGQRPAFTFNMDAIQEFVVVADGATAEFGRSSGGFVNVITKSGTNNTQGTANLSFFNDSMSTQAERADGSKEPEFDSDRLQVGFTLGGPIRENEVFYFLAVDTQGAEQTKQNDPSRIEQRVVDALARFGSPGENGPITRTDDAVVALGKIDWRINPSQLFTAKLNFTDSEQVNGTFDVDSWGRSANAIEADESRALNGSLISTLSSSKLNEFRFQWAREERPRPYNGPINPATNRPLPDTAFDFVNGYRFGMPFFIPVEYYDTRLQLNENLTLLRGDHTWKFGAEYNHTDSVQTFIGFANGRVIFGSTEGFLNYIDNPDYVECSDGSTSQTGVCPPGTDPVGPVLLYLQQVGVGGRTVEEAGTQSIPQKEPALFIQDTWQPRGDLTVEWGLRWEGMIMPDVLTPPEQVFFAPFIGQTVTTAAGPQEFPSDGTIPDDMDNFQPRISIAWDPKGDGSQVVRASAGVYTARIPGLALASSRSTNGSIGQTLFRSSGAAPFLGPVPAYGEIIDPLTVGDPFFPDVFVFDKDFELPETTTFALAYERQVAPNTTVLAKYNYADGDNLTRFTNRNDPLLGSPWGSGLPPGGANGINTLTVVESSARSEYNGITVGANHQGERFQIEGFYTYSKDRSDDDNERDPFSFRYAKITDLDAEYGYSDRDQRDRLNLWAQWLAPKDVNVSFLYQYRSPQPKSITASGADAPTPQARINPDGSVTQRNLGRKDNKISRFDLRVSRWFQLNEGLSIEGIFEVFNLFNSRNPRSPEVTNLIFNFDGTVQSGLGDPRQAQLGVRLRWN